MAEVNLPWKPQPRQADLLAACGLLNVLTGGNAQPPVAPLIGYGGAAYGGKTDGALGVAIIAAVAFPGCRIGFFRRTFPELEGEGGAIDRSLEILGGRPSFATYNAGRHRWTFFNGSSLRFAHCQLDRNKHNYQSNQFDILIFDEATHFTYKIIDYLLTRNRANVEGVVPFALFMTNPGGVGHAYYKSLFVDGPWGVVKRVMLPSGQYDHSIFLSAKIADNVIGVERDPEYESRLRKRDPVLADALIEGNWDVFEGQAFREFRRTIEDKPWHVIPPFDLPQHWPKWRTVDWGYDHPFACHWLTTNTDNQRVYVYRELLQRELTDTQQARSILAKSPPSENLDITFADPSMWAKKTYEEITTSTAEEYADEGVPLTRADNDRKAGKRKVHRFLAPLPDGLPGLQIFSTCTDLIATIPMMIYDDVDTEDVQKMDGDDSYDNLRYGLTSVDIKVKSKPKKGQRKSRLAGVKGI